MLTRRERLLAALGGGEVPNPVSASPARGNVTGSPTDRIPLLGGWVLGDRLHQAITGCSQEEYWRDPARYAVEAHRLLGVDGMIALHVPREPGDYRDGLTKEQFEAYKDRYPSVEDVLTHVRALPSPRDAARAFDAESWRDAFRAHVLAMQARMGELVYLPTLWEEVHPKFEWYNDFGYENYVLFLHLYREEAYRFFESLAAVTRRKSEMAAQVFRELDLVPMTLTGTDICGRNGPVVSPALLREVYWPHVRVSQEPMREAGIKMVWHSDGDFRPIAPDILAAGADGFQGFQEEFGVDLAALAQMRTREGRPLVLWAGPSVTTTLPFGTVTEVKRDVERIINTLAGAGPLFILPANNILPDCPVGNVVAMHRHVIEYGQKVISFGAKRDYEEG